MTSPRTTAELPTGTWQLDPEQTSVTVTAKKLGLISVPGTLSLASGRIEVSADHQVTSVEVQIDAASYESANEKRNEHVRSADFLDASAHPTLEFRADAVAPTEGGYVTDGSATVKGRTTPVSLRISDVTVDGATATFEASTTISRKAVGVDKLPAVIISTDIDVSVTGHAVLAQTNGEG